MKLTYRKIAEDTKEWYSADTSRRAMVGNDCTYYDPETKNCCAVGRFMKHPDNFSLENVGELDFYGLLETNDFNTIMIDSVNNLNDFNFWNRLQYFHDSSTNWDTKSITSDGLIKYNTILELADSLDAER